MPPSVSMRPHLLPAIRPGWRISIHFTRQLLVGILCSENGFPVEGAIHSGLDYYAQILYLLQLIPVNLSSIMVVADPSLSRIICTPHKSPWNMQFQVQRLHAFLQHFELSYVDLHPKTAQFSRKISTFRVPPCHITNEEVTVLWQSR